MFLTFYGDGYSYGFNGQEQDDEVAGEGNSYTAEYWQYDSRLGRRWNVDPVVKVHESPYATFANNPIWFVDPMGADSSISNPSGGNTLIPDGAIINSTFENGKSYSTSDGTKINNEAGAVRSFSHEGTNFVAMFYTSGDKKGQFSHYEGSVTGGISGQITLGFYMVTLNIRQNGFETFINYIDQYGSDYFINNAQRFPHGASGNMATILNSYKASQDGIYISQWTHALIADGTEARNSLEHQIGMFLLAERYGHHNALSVGTANEIRGLIINDEQSGNMLNALSGGQGAFEYKDLINNNAGINLWVQYHVGKMKGLGFFERLNYLSEHGNFNNYLNSSGGTSGYYYPIY